MKYDIEEFRKKVDELIIKNNEAIKEKYPQFKFSTVEEFRQKIKNYKDTNTKKDNTNSISKILADVDKEKIKNFMETLKNNVR